MKILEGLSHRLLTTAVCAKIHLCYYLRESLSKRHLLQLSLNRRTSVRLLKSPDVIPPRLFGLLDGTNLQR